MTEKTLLETTDAIASIGAMLRATNGKLFSLTWIAGLKTEQPYLRSGTFRLDVKKGTTGKGMAYNPLDYGYMSVYDTGIAKRKKAEIARLKTLQDTGVGVAKELQRWNKETCFRMVTLSTVKRFACHGKTWTAN